MCTCAATTDNSYDARAMRARSTRSCSTATLVEQLLLDGRLRNSGNARSIAFRGAVRNERKCAFDDISAHWLPTSSPSCQSIAALGNNTLGPLRHHRETAQSKKARGSQHLQPAVNRQPGYRGGLSEQGPRCAAWFLRNAIRKCFRDFEKIEKLKK